MTQTPSRSLNMNLDELIYLIKNNPEKVRFTDVITVVDQLYVYKPTSFTNGLEKLKIRNEAGTNEGSCKIFAFAKKQDLTQQETLSCFGHYYRDDVLGHPNASDHANIRNFMRFGWNGIQFEGPALELKQ